MKGFPMLSDLSHTFSPPRSPRKVVAALLLGSMLGAGGAIWALSPSLAAEAPLSVTPANPQAGFAPLVAKVKPAVVQIATISPAGAGEGGDGDNDQQQMQQMPDMNGPFGD